MQQNGSKQGAVADVCFWLLAALEVQNAATFQAELCPPEEAISWMKKPWKEWTDANQRGCSAELLCRPPSGTQHNLQPRKPEIGRLKKVNSVEHGKQTQYQEELDGS